jgi:effector-binding domain-containing protein
MTIEPTTSPPTTPQFVELRPQAAAVVLVEGPVEALPRLLGMAFEETAQAITSSRASFAGPPFARYLTMAPAVKAEVGFPYAGDLIPSGRVYRTTLPGGRAVHAVHVGPYETLAATWEATQVWLQAQGLTIAATPWEAYRSEPDATPPVTDIVFPVAEG